MTQQLTQQSALWVERLARFGYVSKGIVYGIVGLLAAQAAFGMGGQTTNTKGALQAIVAQPFGSILLSIVAIGLIGYVLWRFVQAIKDPENKGTDAKGIALRLSYAVNGLIYASLAFTAVGIVLDSSNSSNSNSIKYWIAWLLSQPFGQWLVGIIGAFIIGMSFYQFYKAFTAKFQQELNLTDLSTTEKKWVVGISRFGLAARGIVFCVIGIFLIQAARESDASEAGGLGEALETLSQQSEGFWILGSVAFGLIAYGIYMVIQARYRRINPV